jgi:hypothetical protein
MTRPFHTLMFLLGAMLVQSAQAQDAACTSKTVSLPGELAPWSAPMPLLAGTASSGALPAISTGQAVDMALSAMPDVAFASEPGRAADPSTRGGLARIEISVAGRYRVALGSAAWVDMVAARGKLSSVDHSHGPACSGIRKIVDYHLNPGTYLLQVSGSPTATTRVLVTPLPAA